MIFLCHHIRRLKVWPMQNFIWEFIIIILCNFIEFWLPFLNMIEASSSTRFSEICLRGPYDCIAKDGEKMAHKPQMSIPQRNFSKSFQKRVRKRERERERDYEYVWHKTYSEYLNSISSDIMSNFLSRGGT